MSDPRVAEAMRLADAPWVIRCHLMPEPYRAALEAHLTQLVKEAAQAAYAECARLGWKTPALGLEPVAWRYWDRETETYAVWNTPERPSIVGATPLYAHPSIQAEKGLEPVAHELMFQRRLQSPSDLCKNEWYPWEEVFAPGMTVREPEIYEYAWFAQAPVLAPHPPIANQRAVASLVIHEPLETEAVVVGGPPISAYECRNCHGPVPPVKLTCCDDCFLSVCRSLEHALAHPPVEKGLEPVAFEYEHEDGGAKLAVHVEQEPENLHSSWVKIGDLFRAHPPVQPTLPDQVQAAVDEHAVQPTEPVAIVKNYSGTNAHNNSSMLDRDLPVGTKLYAHPPVQPTDERAASIRAKAVALFSDTPANSATAATEKTE